MHTHCIFWFSILLPFQLKFDTILISIYMGHIVFSIEFIGINKARIANLLEKAITLYSSVRDITTNRPVALDILVALIQQQGRHCYNY